MESLLNRYRNITVLLLVIAAQLILLAVQVKNNRDIPFIRVWTVTAVTPIASVVEWFRGGSSGFLHNYVFLHDADAENRRLREEVGRLKMDNIFLRNELRQADRARALQVFQSSTQSKTLAARTIGAGAGSGSKTIYVDRGSVEGVERGMAVVTPEGIVGKVIASYPTASEVLLVNDPDFAAGVVSQKNQTRGTLKGQGNGPCKVDYVPLEEKVEVGEWFYTSGDDRIFPRGFPVGTVTAVHEGQPFKEIQVEPSGFQHGLEDMLIILSGVHQEIPDTPPGNQPVYIAPAPPDALKSTTPDASGAPVPASGATAPATEADRLRAHYKALGDAQNHVFGENLPGQKPPNFNLVLPPGGVQPPSKQSGVQPPAKQSGVQPPAKQSGGQAPLKPDGVPPASKQNVPPPPAQPDGTVAPAKPGAPPGKSPAVPPGGGGR
jgi:rod shape-determining protein MreC